MQIGYARFSTLEQNVAPQIDQLKQAGCERNFRDKASGAKTERAGLQEVLNLLRAGDSLVVWRLDRLGRSLKHLLEKVSELEECGIGFQSLQENIDTTTSGGRLIQTKLPRELRRSHLRSPNKKALDFSRAFFPYWSEGDRSFTCKITVVMF